MEHASRQGGAISEVLTLRLRTELEKTVHKSELEPNNPDKEHDGETEALGEEEKQETTVD